MKNLQSRTLLAAAAMSLAAAAPAFAQKGHGGEGAHPMPAPHPMGQANAKREEMHEADRAKMEEAKHEGRRVEKAEDKMEDRAGKDAKHAAKAMEKREDKAEKALDRTEHKALNAARHDGKTSKRGIRLTSAERAPIRAIDKKYDAQLRALEAQDRADEKAGKPDNTALVARINAIRDQERAEIRAILTPAQQTEFDRNITTARH